MKYYLIAGEASGDLHASHLMAALRERDADAEFRFIGGDLMAAVGGTQVQHYRDLAYMGFIPVLCHLPQILRGMRQCRRDILQWQPDRLILVDYPGFNLRMARYIKEHAPQIRIVYYIAPKIWAWKEGRIRKIRGFVDQLLSILPFEVDYYRTRHNYEVQYVGNPTLDEVRAYEATHPANFAEFIEKNHLSDRPIIALLPGSRQQEIRDNLRRMIQAAQPLAQHYQFLVAGAPGIPSDYYAQFLHDFPGQVLYGQTYPILQHATAAHVTSGTATLETTLFRVPQVVCYYIACGRFVSFLRRVFVKVPYISLVNLIANREVVPELVAHQMTADAVRTHLLSILPGEETRERMLRDYDDVIQRLGAPGAPHTAARLIVEGD